jgi:hypothetical protein
MSGPRIHSVYGRAIRRAKIFSFPLALKQLQPGQPLGSVQGFQQSQDFQGRSANHSRISWRGYDFIETSTAPAKVRSPDLRPRI